MPTTSIESPQRNFCDKGEPPPSMYGQSIEQRLHDMASQASLYRDDMAFIASQAKQHRNDMALQLEKFDSSIAKILLSESSTRQSSAIVKQEKTGAPTPIADSRSSNADTTQPV